MRYFSMFSGIGGFELGIQRAYDNKSAYFSKESESEERKQGRFGDIDKSEELFCIGENPPLCVGFSEIDKYSIATYQKHFPTHKNYGDATKINTDELPDFDMLCGGFPCQSFSIAGKRKGFQDTRGTLFYEILRIAKAKRPRLLFLENVKGLHSADDGRCFATIISSLDELGYDVEWQVLNSKHFGVPQNRERVFIIGHLREGCTRQVLPLRESADIPAEEREQETDEIAQCVTATTDKRGKGSHNRMIQNSGKELARVYSTDGIGPALKTQTGGWQEPKIAVPVLTPDREEKRQNGRRFKEDGEEMFSLTSQDIHGVMIDRLYAKGNSKPNRSCIGAGRVPEVGNNQRSIRRLTPVECERLQGFPDNWTKSGIFNERPTRQDLLEREQNPNLWAYHTKKYGEEVCLREISDRQRYRQCGNAVTVNVIQAIVEQILCKTAKRKRS